MKILLIVTWFGKKNGDKVTGNFHLDYAKNVSQKCEVAIYYPFDNDISSEFEYGYEDGILVFRGKSGARFNNNMKKWISDYKIIEKIYKTDVIHSNVVSGAGVVASVLKVRFGIPFIVTEHSPKELINCSFRGKTVYKLITGMSRKNIAVSPFQRDCLNRVFKCGFVYINNGVKDPMGLITFQEKFYIQNRINIACVCALYSKEIKGLQYLLPAVKRISDEGKCIHLHICGGGEYLDYFKKLSKELNVDDIVTFYGMCDKEKLYSILNQMDFAVSSSLYESAGVAVEEACMLGLPQVITNSGGANSLIPDEYAIKVGKSSVNELYLGIKKMINKYMNYDRRLIREYGLREFNIEEVCNKYVSIYKSVIQKEL